MDLVRTILWTCYIIVQAFLASFLIQPFILLLIYGGRKIFVRKEEDIYITPIKKNYHFGVIITAHREIAFIPPIVDSLLKQTYYNFNVYIVADDCDISTLHFQDPRVHLLKPPLPFNTNSKSINYAVDHFHDADEIMVLFDPDNLVHPRFLEVLNIYYNKGYKAAQGNLYSKNAVGTYEKIDSAGVVFNNFIDRDIRSVLGFSVNIWGCGVSVDRKVYEKINYDNRSQMGGFDKHMQAEIAKNIPCIAYAKEAILYDEKVSDGKNLEKQRTRWISAYFKFLGDAFSLFFSGIRRFDLNLTYFGYNLIRPPYFLQVLIAILFIKINFWVHTKLCVAWILILTVFILSVISIVEMRTSDKKVSKGIWYMMPLFFYHQVRSFFKLKMNKHSILKTEHSKILYIDDLLKHGTP
jgi:glycosyltransferase involved in cell wall biosynthesis